MKKYIYIKMFIFTVIFITGCEESILDKVPHDTISESAVWQDKSLVDNYLANVYFETDFSVRFGEQNQNNQNSAQSVNAIMIASMGAEGRSYGAHHDAYQASINPMEASGINPSLDYWKYNNIRNCNELIKQLGSGSDLNEDFKTQRVAEARFLRAYMYFQMVIRFGGVPLITEVPDANVNIDELYVPRNSEKEVYDFIISEMDELVDILPSDYSAADRGRPTKWAAYALQSRAALYAASIARYGTIQTVPAPLGDLVLGIPASEEANYAKVSYDASNAIIASGKHSLYKEYEDPSENFEHLFYDESDANKEVIMWLVYDYSKNRAHAYASRATPHEFNESWGTMYYLYDHLEHFEYKDGTPGNSISRQELASKEWSMDELYANRDPRFNASVFYPESPWKGGKAYFHSGTLRNGELLTSGQSEDGWNYKAIERNTTKTGFMIKKRLNPAIQPTGFNLQNDDTDYIIFRLGEIYLNLAEAAFYLNKPTEALVALNKVRERAGMPDKTEITEDNIQNERLVELTMENQSYWDLRRWRIAEDVLNGKRMQGIKWIYNFDTQKYQITFINAESVPRIFQNYYYYLPLGIDRVTENPNMVENPGY